MYSLTDLSMVLLTGNADQVERAFAQTIIDVDGH
jgi:hypothetical protein